MEARAREGINPSLPTPFVPVQQRVIEWDDDGQPVLTSHPVLTRHHVQTLYFALAAQPYVCEDPLSPDFLKYDGMTLAEVIVRKQLERAASSGDSTEIERVIDRLLGKPKNIGESVTVHASYEDVLKSIAAKTAAPSMSSSVVDTEESIFGDLV